MNISIGTANFGQKYGVNGSYLNYDDIYSILKYAYDNNIKSIDTAEAYGNAQILIGTFLKDYGMNNKFRITSKLSPQVTQGSSSYNILSNMEMSLDCSLKQLSVDVLDCYMLHDSRSVFNTDLIESFIKLKEKGKVLHLGVSVYEPEEVEAALEFPEIDCIELPYNVLDHRMSDVIKKSQRKRIYARSVFLQGILLRKSNDLPQSLIELKPYIIQIEKICEKYGITKEELAIGFAKKNHMIDNIVVGVDSLQQIKNINECIKTEMEDAVVEEVEKTFDGIRKELILPTFWER